MKFPKAVTIDHGWLEGHVVRTARKPHRCDYSRGASNGGLCRHVIQPGERYVEGELQDGTSCPWALKRYCMDCAGPEARESLEAWVKKLAA